MGQSLEELKAENAAADIDTEQNTDAVYEEIEDEASNEEVEEGAETEESEATESPEAELEAWQLTEEQTSDDNDSFTSSDVAAVRRKFKGKLDDQKTENADLKAQIEALQAQVNGGNVPANNAPSQPLPRPSLEAFGYDEALYNQALDQWYGAQIDQRLQQTNQMQSQQAAHSQAKQAVEQAVSSHYQRAVKLAQDSGISAEVYQGADRAVRQVMESAMPGKGDAVADEIISRLGEGSEKVTYYVGRNAAAQSELQRRLREDESGLSAAMYLGQLKSEITMPKKRKSNAPKPAPHATGGSNVPTTAGDFKKKYQKAVKSGDMNAAINAKMDAKKAGVKETNKW